MKRHLKSYNALCSDYKLNMKTLETGHESFRRISISKVVPQPRWRELPGELFQFQVSKVSAESPCRWVGGAYPGFSFAKARTVNVKSICYLLLYLKNLLRNIFKCSQFWYWCESSLAASPLTDVAIACQQNRQLRRLSYSRLFSLSAVWWLFWLLTSCVCNCYVKVCYSS